MIEELIKAQMANCIKHDNRYCEYQMCSECQFCEKNIRLEYDKVNNFCPKCHGYQIVGVMTVNGGGITSKEMVCNVCGGTGKYHKK